MSYTTTVVLSLSIAFPAFAGLVRLRQIDERFYPFVLLCCLGLVSEVSSMISVRVADNNVAVYNFYSLVEPVVLLWQFRRWGLFRQWPTVYFLLQGGFLLAWCLEHFVYGTPASFSSCHTIAYSLLVVVLSIPMLTHVLVFQNHRLLFHARFLILTGLLFFFAYAAFLEVVWMEGQGFSALFRKHVYDLLAYVNFIVNLLFGFAVLWIPRKLPFIMP